MKMYNKHGIGLFILILIGVALASTGVFSADITSISGVALAKTSDDTKAGAPEVPFYSQFSDIQSSKWQKVGCGIASLAMLINFYQPEAVSVNALLKEGIAAGAFISNAGWSHKGLTLLAKKYNLKGEVYDLSQLNADAAFAKFENLLKDGPAIASVHYKLDPKNPIPHLVVINGISNGMVNFNDPAEKSGGKDISTQDFIKAWKKRFITIRS